jgi:hypothetical protein
LGFDAVIGFARSAAQSTILIAGSENQKPPRSRAGVQFEFTAVAKARQAMIFAGNHFLPRHPEGHERARVSRAPFTPAFGENGQISGQVALKDLVFVC